MINKIIQYGQQTISDDDVEAVVKILRSDFLTQGPITPLFEKAIADKCKANFGIAVNSATAALHVACLALDLKPGDWLWTSPSTFVASANCALYCGAQVDFVDIDPLTYNMSVPCLEKKLAASEKEGKLPKVVIPVHLCGQSCEMKAIYRLGQKYGFKVIEDAAHAIGGKYLDEPIGNCRYSDITVFSFHPVKIITTGEGGMALTNDVELAERMRRFRSHGITSDPDLMHSRPSNEIWNYQQIDLGYNFRMTDIQAALGLNQLQRLDKFVSKRQEIANLYDQRLSATPLQLPFQHPDTYSSYHLYPIRVKESNGSTRQKKVYDDLQAADINVNIHYIPSARYCTRYTGLPRFGYGN